MLSIVLGTPEVGGAAHRRIGGPCPALSQSCEASWYGCSWGAYVRACSRPRSWVLRRAVRRVLRRFLRRADRACGWLSQAAADAYGVRLCVLTSYKDSFVIEIEGKRKGGGPGEAGGRVLWLSFWAEVHYNSLYKA